VLTNEDADRTVMHSPSTMLRI